MKKLFKIIVAVLLLTTINYSQEIGVRFGDVTGGNVAIDGIFSIGSLDRVHANISFGSGSVGVDLLWNFIYKPLSGEALKWYAGVGPFLDIQDPFGLGIVGEIGLEYRFNNIPISISTDWRPAFRIIENTDFKTGGFGFNIRYVIN